MFSDIAGDINDHRATKKIANRGKWAEGRVKNYLKSLEAADATHYRPPDARAGSLQTTPSDFMFLRAGKFFLIEVKEVDHDSRLPHKNFSVDKVARMRNWKAAGATCSVLIYYRTIRQWRCMDIDLFIHRDGGSWNLINYSCFDERTVLGWATTFRERV